MSAWMYHVSASSPAPCSETIRGVPRKFLVIGLSLGFSGLVFERLDGGGTAREVNEKSNKAAEDREHEEQQHQHAGQHALRQLRVAVAETNGARLCRGRIEQNGQHGQHSQF